MPKLRPVVRALSAATVISALALSPMEGTAATLTFRVPLKGLTATSNASSGQSGPVITTGDISFGGVPTSTMSAGQLASLTNAGGQPFTVTQVTTAAPFSVTQNCVGQVLAAGQTCSGTVTYHPTSGGPSQGTVTFGTSAGSAAINVSGYAGTPGISVPSSIDMGEVFHGQWSAEVALPITNTGAIPLHPTVAVGYGPIASNYQITNSCASVAVGATCTDYVSMTPFSYGESTTGWLTVTSEAGTTEVTTDVLSLYYQASVSPASLSFGSVAVGSVSPVQTITVSNTGNAPNPVSVPNPAPPFQIVSDTCTVIPVGGSCTIGVAFSPTSKGPYLQTFWIYTGGQNWGPALSGTGS